MTVTHDPHDEPCDAYMSLLVRAADDGLDAMARQRLDAHLASCDGCRAAFDAQRIAHELIAGAFDLDGRSLGFTTRVLAHLEPREHGLDRLDFRRWTWRLSPVAASLLLAAWAVAAWSETSAAATDVVSTASSGEYAAAVLLSDAIDQTDLVSLTWEAEVASVAFEETPQ
jgi:predicted anti-sigma-YlaC factor YlaD